MEQLMLDLIPTGAKAVCHVSQNDIGRTIRFNLTSGNTAYTLAGTETIKVFIKKPDGTTAERNIANTSSTYVDWVTGEGDCDVAGKNECELVITAGSTVIGSKNFTMKVEEDPYNGQGVVIETAGPAPIATFTTNIIDLFVEIKCEINAIQEGTPWIDSNVIEKEPYNFRKVAGTASRIGNHLFDKLVGGTVAWNQKADGYFTNRSTISVTGHTCVITADGGASYFGARIRESGNADFDTIDGHKYFITEGVKDISITNLSGINVSYGTKNPIGAIVNIKTNGKFSGFFIGTGRTFYINAAILNGQTTSTSDTFTLYDVNVIDLTAMFGSTIADYIYSLEQATAGSGVNFFRKLFSKDYYAYNAGELISVKTTAHKMVGKNLYNADFPTTTKGSITLTNNGDGSYTLNGSNPNDTYFDIFIDSSISKLPKDTYRLTGCPSGGSDSTYFMYTVPNFHTDGSSGSTFTDSVTGGSICIKGGVVCNNLIFKPMLRLSNSGDDTFEPYTEHNYALDDVELRGLFKLDSNNKLYADGDTYESSGDVTRKFNIINLGSINWTKTDYAEFRSNYASNNIPLPKNRNADVKANALCSKVYDVLTAGQTYRGNNRGIATADNYLSIGDSTYETAEALKTALDEVYFIYEVETLTTETADPFTNPQEVDANGTEEYVDNRSVAIPVGHETYYADIYDISGFTTCKVSVKDGSNVEQKSATISFGQTVYDGILEHKNGAWTFTGTHALLEKSIGDMNNGENYPGWKASGVKALIGADLNERFRNQKLNIGTEFSVNTISTSDELYLDKTTYGLTQSQWKATCPDLIVQFRVPLATPFTLTLTGAQLETLLGENRVSHNCNGDTEVKYLYNA